MTQFLAKSRHISCGLRLLLCKEQNRLVAEYALRGIGKPMGVAEYQLLREIPQPLATDLPSIEEIEAELRDEG